MKFKTPFNNLNHGKTYEKFTRPSVAVPDQTMSISTIMARYARGLPISGNMNPVYNGDMEDADEIINYERMDKIEKIEFQRRKQEELKEMYNMLEVKNKEDMDKKRQAEIDRLVNEKINILKKPSPPGNEGDKGPV